MAGPAFLQTALAKAYPRSASGRLTSLSSSSSTVDMQLGGSGTGTLDVWVPASSTPSVSSSGLTGLTVSPQSGGGWRLTAPASGSYALGLTAG